MPRPEPSSLWDLAAAAGGLPLRVLADSRERVALAELVQGRTIATPLEKLRGRSVLISSDRQLVTALALLDLDGIAARIVLCPPDLPAAYLPAAIAEGQVDTIIGDGTGPATQAPLTLPLVPCGAKPFFDPSADTTRQDERRTDTEWVLFTSGTTGRPKLVAHSLASLTGPISDRHGTAGAVWSTFYDIRRYGGLQVLLRALLGGASMVFSDPGEGVASFLTRAGEAGVTHLSGTPSHWRRALMSPAVSQITPRYIRLSGEVADQTILNRLAAAFPAAKIAHAFASTEAGVAFEVTDGLAGFPAALIGQADAKTELRIADGLLRIRSARAARCYLGDRGAIADADGFVTTGDLVSLRGDRYYFVGRQEGVINVGGQKVYPEEVEAIIAQHPKVRMARVRGRPNPITGALVTADVVILPSANPASLEEIRSEILGACRAGLPAHKVPATLQVVTAIDITEAGKMVRRHA